MQIKLTFTDNELKIVEKYKKFHSIAATARAVKKMLLTSPAFKENESGIYGEFKNIKLKGFQFQNLFEKLGEQKAEMMIEKLSKYVEATGKEYNSHYATILMWAERDQEKLDKERLANEPVDLDLYA